MLTLSPFAAAATKAALVSKSNALELMFSDEVCGGAKEMVEVTAGADECIVSIRALFLGKVTTGVVRARGFPAGALQKTTRDKLTFSAMHEVTAGLGGACMMTVCCINGAGCGGSSSTLFCRFVKAMAAAVAAAFAATLVEMIGAGWADGTTVTTEESAAGSRITRVPLTYATWCCPSAVASSVRADRAAEVMTEGSRL